MLDLGILGINARNLLYIRKFNSLKGIQLAQNKNKTKIFLSERGIPVPQTYALVKDKLELSELDMAEFPLRDFVIKPNKGSKGQGILIVKYLRESKQTISKRTWIDKIFKTDMDRFSHVYKVGGEVVDDYLLKKHLIDILDGQYSLSSNDQVLIEEKLIPGNGFEDFCSFGLADIRVIVFKLVPVAAMVRVPTQSSGGKANLAQGGIGLGIDIGTGKITSYYQNRQIYTAEFPGEFSEFENKKIPFWDDILLYSSQIQQFVNLGYLALDWVITEEGPKLLEINSRAGLEVQNVCAVNLKRRLDSLKNIKPVSPEKGVEICKALFTNEGFAINSKVIFLSQEAKVYYKNIESDFLVKVDLNEEKSFTGDKSLIEKEISIDFETTGAYIKDIILYYNRELDKNEIVLGRQDVGDFYIKPSIQIVAENISVIKTGEILSSEESYIKTLDQKVSKLGNKLYVGSILKPINYDTELKTFLDMKGEYNPQFLYKRPSDEQIENTSEELNALMENYFTEEFTFKSNFANLFEDKINELITRNNLIKAYKKQDFEKIYKYNTQLFGKIIKENLELSEEKIKEEPLKKENILGRKLETREVISMITNHLKFKNIEGVEIIENKNNMARISIVQKGKKVFIRINPLSEFWEYEVKSIFAHEIDIHLVRIINGAITGWEILKDGTANYIIDEEGLAVYNSMKYTPENYEKRGMYQKYNIINIGVENDFTTLSTLLMDTNATTLKKAFSAATRVKKGIENTASNEFGAIYMKDKIYLDGYMKIKSRIEQENGNLEDLMIGKIKIDDLIYFK